MKLKESMFIYYDERADEYDEIYTLGGDSASITNPDVYKNDVFKAKESIQKQITKGVVFDVPCGTAFWMPVYYQNADQIILIDQSSNMLKKAKERATTLNYLQKCQFFLLDAFKMDSIQSNPSVFLIGFFLSHLTLDEEIQFFSIIKNKIN